MKVIAYLGKLSDGHEVVMTIEKLNPYVIVTNYDPDTMSWASAYGYYPTLGDLARGINELESRVAKEKVYEGLDELARAWKKIEDNYDNLADMDNDFENAFGEYYPFEKSFDEVELGFWVHAVKAYLDGYRKVGQTEPLVGHNKWGYPDED